MPTERDHSFLLPRRLASSFRYPSEAPLPITRALVLGTAAPPHCRCCCVSSVARARRGGARSRVARRALHRRAHARRRGADRGHDHDPLEAIRHREGECARECSPSSAPSARWHRSSPIRSSVQRRSASPPRGKHLETAADIAAAADLMARQLSAPDRSPLSARSPPRHRLRARALVDELTARLDLDVDLRGELRRVGAAWISWIDAPPPPRPAAAHTAGAFIGSGIRRGAGDRALDACRGHRRRPSTSPC